MTPAPIPIDMPRFCGSFMSPVVTEKSEMLTLAQQILCMKNLDLGRTVTLFLLIFKMVSRVI